MILPKTPRELARLVDHTLLKPDATKEDVRRVAHEVVQHGFFSLCVAPARVAQAHEILTGSEAIVMSIAGFPLGSATTTIKAAEAREVVKHGAREVDMVLHVGALKERDDAYVVQDIRAVVTAADGAPVKVILETCLLDDAEKRRACELAIEGGAAFVKTSTGFSTAGASVADVRLMKAAVRGRVKVKAAAGIRDLRTALALLEAGADRLGMSHSVPILNELVMASK